MTDTALALPGWRHTPRQGAQPYEPEESSEHQQLCWWLPRPNLSL